VSGAKVLLFFEYGSLNGGEFSLLALLEALGQTEFEFVAAAPAEGMLGERLERCGVRVLPLTLRDAQGRKLSIEQINCHLVELVGRVSPDLVHSNSLSMGRMAGRIASEFSVPFTAHLRDIIKLNRTAVSDLNRCAGLIAVSNATKRYHVEQGLSGEKVEVIYNGVDSDRFRPAASTGALKRELGLGESAVLIGNIGQICLRKGQVLLARAAVRLADEFGELNTLFVGERYSQKEESVEYEEEIGRIFRQAGIEGRLFCLGFRQDIPEILNEVDLVVHAAHQEPLGRVLLEGAACGVAIVATDVGGTGEILTDEVSALLVPSDDVEALAGAMRRMLKDEQLRMRLGQEARTAAVEKFSLSTAAACVRMFWKSFL
jgi:glycosyltransferase involved in cell wall biosynthesis